LVISHALCDTEAQGLCIAAPSVPRERVIFRTYNM
jgi:hypothetical protein